MAGKTFIDVLEAQIRADLRAEIEAEVRAKLGYEPHETQFARPSGHVNSAGDRLATWLATHIEKTTFVPGPRARREYGAQQEPKKGTSTGAFKPSYSAPKAAPAEPRITVALVEDICRLELLRRHGAHIGDSFTRAELKSAWRKAALKTHPDRFAQADQKTQIRMAATFREIKAVFTELERLFANGAKANESTRSRAA
jgi:hypothetical protein